MTDKTALPVYLWRARLTANPEQWVPVKAAYLNYDNEDFVEFRDGNHKTIYIINKDALIDAGRVDTDGAKRALLLGTATHLPTLINSDHDQQ